MSAAIKATILLAHGSIDITPSMRMPLAGFPDRSGDFEDIGARLEISLVILKQENKYVLFYCVDTLFVPDELFNAVMDKYGTMLNLGEADIWMQASHTHFAPALDKQITGLGSFDPSYFAFVKSQLLQLTEQVLSTNFKEVSVSFHESTAAINVSRRKRLLRFDNGKFSFKTLLYPDYNKPTDTGIKLIKFTNADGVVEAMIWSYACHPVHFVNRLTVTSEYIGIIRQHVKEHLNTGVTVLFMQGFSGDLKADITTVTHTRFADKVRYLFQYKPKYTNFPTESDYKKWVELLWSRLKQCLDSSCIASKNIQLGIAESKLDIENLSHGDVPVQVRLKSVSFSPVFTIVGLSAEVVCDYSKIVKTIFSEHPVITTGCQNGTCIYLPTDRQIAEGGYEVDGFKKLFGVTGKIKPGIDERVQKALYQLKQSEKANAR